MTGSAVRRRVFRRGRAFARGTNSPWRCSTSRGRCYRTGGWPVTTRWADRPSFAGNYARVANPGAPGLAVPSNTLIRDLETNPPANAGNGRPAKQPFVQVQRWCAGLSASAWTRLDVRDGTKGPLVIEAVQCRVQARLGKGVGPEESRRAGSHHA